MHFPAHRFYLSIWFLLFILCNCMIFLMNNKLFHFLFTWNRTAHLLKINVILLSSARWFLIWQLETFSFTDPDKWGEQVFNSHFLSLKCFLTNKWFPMLIWPKLRFNHSSVWNPSMGIVIVFPLSTYQLGMKWSLKCVLTYYNGWK